MGTAKEQHDMKAHSQTLTQMLKQEDAEAAAMAEAAAREQFSRGLITHAEFNHLLSKLYQSSSPAPVPAAAPEPATMQIPIIPNISTSHAEIDGTAHSPDEEVVESAPLPSWMTMPHAANDGQR